MKINIWCSKALTNGKVRKKKKNKGNCLSRELYAITNYVFSKEWLPEKLMTLGYVLMIHEEKIVAAKSYDKDREK